MELEFHQCDYVYNRGSKKGFQCCNRTRHLYCFRHNETMKKRRIAKEKREKKEAEKSKDNSVEDGKD